MHDHYTYRVSWSEDDGEYVATCAEFPSLSHLAADQIEALLGLRDLIQDVVADMRKNRAPVPQPLADAKYSGRFVTRVPPELHRRLAIEAAEAHVSMSRLVSLRLAMTTTELTTAPLAMKLDPVDASAAKHRKRRQLSTP
jgi:predicted RNase H-like HicB family nuclease